MGRWLCSFDLVLLVLEPLGLISIFQRKAHLRLWKIHQQLQNGVFLSSTSEKCYMGHLEKKACPI
jgi:hypothetical protein